MGKSSILEALDIFFENTSMDQDDASVHTPKDSTVVVISCEFIEFPDELILDSTVPTSLEKEYCLNKSRRLEIIKKYDCSRKSIKPSVFLKAYHPNHEKAINLLTLTQAKLKGLAKELGAELTNLKENPAIRSDIWSHLHSEGDLEFEEKEIPLTIQDAKRTWEALKKTLPVFALFQSDRKSDDSESEIQDPMKLAIKEAIQSLEPVLEKIESEIKEHVEKVAQNTLEKLQEMDEELAKDLKPYFKSERKWDSLFKLSIEDDNKVPMNKRGSGVRRLIALNFFRAEAERKRNENDTSNVIYAFEEPENSQHPDNQKMLIEAFQSLAEEDGCQVILTTHNPTLAELIVVEDLRFVYSENGKVTIANEENLSENIRQKIAETLGVFPRADLSKVKVLICVEGQNDVNFLRGISKIIHSSDPSLPDLEVSEENCLIAFVPLGGSQLKSWVAEHYLKNLNVPEFHLYDNDKPEYQKQVKEVNNRDNKDFAIQTSKREMENYLHGDAIQQARRVQITVSDTMDLPQEVAGIIYSQGDGKYSWTEVIAEKEHADLLKKKVSKVKKWLNTDAVMNMNIELIEQRDPAGDIKGWLRKIEEYFTD